MAGPAGGDTGCYFLTFGGAGLHYSIAECPLYKIWNTLVPDQC